MFQISHMFRCVRVQGLDTTEGLLLFGKEHLYVIDGFTLLKVGTYYDTLLKVGTMIICSR